MVKTPLTHNSKYTAASPSSSSSSSSSSSDSELDSDDPLDSIPELAHSVHISPTADPLDVIGLSPSATPSPPPFFKTPARPPTSSNRSRGMSGGSGFGRSQRSSGSRESDWRPSSSRGAGSAKRRRYDEPKREYGELEEEEGTIEDRMSGSPYASKRPTISPARSLLSRLGPKVEEGPSVDHLYRHYETHHQREVSYKDDFDTAPHPEPLPMRYGGSSDSEEVERVEYGSERDGKARVKREPVYEEEEEEEIEEEVEMDRPRSSRLGQAAFRGPGGTLLTNETSYFPGESPSPDPQAGNVYSGQGEEWDNARPDTPPIPDDNPPLTPPLPPPQALRYVPPTPPLNDDGRSPAPELESRPETPPLPGASAGSELGLPADESFDSEVAERVEGDVDKEVIAAFSASATAADVAEEAVGEIPKAVAEVGEEQGMDDAEHQLAERDVEKGDTSVEVQEELEVEIPEEKEAETMDGVDGGNAAAEPVGELVAAPAVTAESTAGGGSDIAEVGEAEMAEEAVPTSPAAPPAETYLIDSAGTVPPDASVEGRGSDGGRSSPVEIEKEETADLGEQSAAIGATGVLDAHRADETTPVERADQAVPSVADDAEEASGAGAVDAVEGHGDGGEKTEDDVGADCQAAPVGLDEPAGTEPENEAEAQVGTGTVDSAPEAVAAAPSEVVEADLDAVVVGLAGRPSTADPAEISSPAPALSPEIPVTPTEDEPSPAGHVQVEVDQPVIPAPDTLSTDGSTEPAVGLDILPSQALLQPSSSLSTVPDGSSSPPSQPAPAASIGPAPADRPGTPLPITEGEDVEMDVQSTSPVPPSSLVRPTIQEEGEEELDPEDLADEDEPSSHLDTVDLDSQSKRGESSELSKANTPVPLPAPFVIPPLIDDDIIYNNDGSIRKRSGRKAALKPEGWKSWHKGQYTYEGGVATKKPDAGAKKGKVEALKSAARGRSNSSPMSDTSDTPLAIIKSQPPAETIVATEDTADEEEEAGDDEEIYCPCGKESRSDGNDTLVGCDGCDIWFHAGCVDLSEEEIELMDKFFCADCEKATGRKTTIKKVCKRDGCNKEFSPKLSKFCSDRCGFLVAQAKIDAMQNKKAVKQVALALASYPSPPPDIRVIDHLPTAPTLLAHLSVIPISPDSIDFLNKQIEAAQSQLLMLEKRLLLLGKAAEQCESLPPLHQPNGNDGKKRKTGGGDDRPCGWVEGLIWEDEEVRAWEEGMPLGPVEVVVQEEREGEDVVMGEEGAAGLGGYCMNPRKRCDRHSGWQKTMPTLLDIEMTQVQETLSGLTAERDGITASAEAKQAGKVARENLHEVLAVNLAKKVV